MDDNGWDIGEIVRSCNTNKRNNVEAPNLDLESQNFKNDEWNFIDRSPLAVEVTNFDCLDELFSMNFSMNFSAAHKEKSDDQSSRIINPTIPGAIFVNQVKITNQNDNQQLLQPVQSAQLSQQVFLPPPPPPITCVPATTAAPQKWIAPQQQLMVRDNVHPTFTFPVRDPLIQNYKKKNQSIKFIYELTRGELIADPWAWRKYGQKLLRGSPFPRNYYRCSTSKDCQAKKQIEKSPKDENLFLVTYSDEHNHPPPTKRSSILDCNICSKSELSKGINTVPKDQVSSTSSSSSWSKHSKRARVDTSPINAAEEKGEDEEERVVFDSKKIRK